MRRISITHKLVLYFITLGIISILIIGFYSFFTFKKALMERTFEQLTSIKVVKKKRIESFFSDRIHDIQFISKSEDIQNYLSNKKDIFPKRIHINAPIYNIKINRYLLPFLSSSTYYKSIFIVDKKGKTLHFNSAQSDTFYIPEPNTITQLSIYNL